MKKRNLFLFLFFFIICTSSCSEDLSRTEERSSISTWENLPLVDRGYGRILKDNPIILSNQSDLAEDYPLDSLLRQEQDPITQNITLFESCGKPDGSSIIRRCYQLFPYSNTSPLINEEGRWIYDPSTEEFLQVHTFGHIRISMTHEMNMVYQSYQTTYPSSTSSSFISSLPRTMYEKYAYWNGTPLTIYSQCNISPEEMAYFNPGQNFICFAKTEGLEHFRIHQDPTIIYHEFAHYFTLNFINLRNMAPPTGMNLKQKTDLGVLFYDEGTSINEGLSDFFSYSINQRPYIGEWGLSRFFNAGRAMTENDSRNPPGINRAKDSRLAYPDYINFDINNPSIPTEDSHAGGQIATYFLVALNEELQNSCLFDFSTSTQVIYHALMETKASLGDLTTYQFDSNTSSRSRINFYPISDKNGSLLSKRWAEMINPINYRKFFQMFSKKILDIVIKKNLYHCRGSFTKDQLEEILDIYGLLLFKTYNDNGNGYDPACALSTGDDSLCQWGHQETLTKVNQSNMRRSLLISKEALMFNPDPQTENVTIFDNHDNILPILSFLMSTGHIQFISPLIPSDLSYNNGNGQIGPGEVVGIGFNLYNNSNVTMGGVQILGNDWSHARLEDNDPEVPFSGELRFCGNFDDEFPQEEANAAEKSDAPYQVGDCERVTRTNGNQTLENPKDLVTPICFVAYSSTSGLIWVSQDTYREAMNIDSSRCLLGKDSPYDCFVRMIPGADQAFYSKILPKSTWEKSLSEGVINNDDPSIQKPEGQVSGFQWNAHNMMMMEISPHVPLGTTFNCRFRARFTNCNECWQDPERSDKDDYLDYEYSGAKPFKILNYQFTITN